MRRRWTTGPREAREPGWARGRSVGTLCDVGLAAYRHCTFREKREVLAVFWSRRAPASDTVAAAAREYGPYALAMVIVIAVELATIAVVLVAKHNAWSWPAVVLTGLALASARLTWVRLRTIASAVGPDHASR